MKVYDKTIFIFRRDYRLYDNIGLIEALKKSIHVIPIFILTPEQLVHNEYKSDNAVQFMIESLNDLDKELKNKGSKLYYFYGKPSVIIKKLLISVKGLDAVFVNRDYTPYSKKRDLEIEEVCKKKKKAFESYEDSLMHPVGSIRSGSDEIYVKFTPYFTTAKKVKVNEPIKNNYNNYFKGNIEGEYKGSKKKFYNENEDISVHGGRELALKILSGIKKFSNYNKVRNTLSIPTTRLSAYIKFGCVSIREVYHKIKDVLGMNNDLIKQLYWREFYYNIGDAHPELLEKKKNFKENYNKIPWITYDKASDKQKKEWKAWTNGTTGFPIVDASMRQINTIGYMENRARLIVASFLVKDMFWSPFEGEKYFSQYLVDIDWIVNCASVGNWGWVSGGSVDTMPFFRVFSPLSQNLRFDPECIYIKTWIPELKDIPNEHIIEWNKYYNLYPDIKYPKPMLDHSSSAKKAIEKYKKSLYN